MSYQKPAQDVARRAQAQRLRGRSRVRSAGSRCAQVASQRRGLCRVFTDEGSSASWVQKRVG